MGITPSSHPKVVDLCAGNGCWAVRFINNGWNPQNITCINYARPNPPLVDGLSWVYWDLQELGWRLHRGEPIPSEITQMKGAFDCVVTSYGGNCGGLRYDDEICEFLAREGGFIWPDNVPYLKSSRPSDSNP